MFERVAALFDLLYTTIRLRTTMQLCRDREDGGPLPYRRRVCGTAVCIRAAIGGMRRREGGAARKRLQESMGKRAID